MFPRSRTALLAVVAVGLSGGMAQAQVKLQFKFPEKTSATYVESAHVDQTLSVNGMDIPTKTDQAVRTRQDAGGARQDGSVPVTQTIEAMKLSLELPGGISINVDSEDKNPPPAGELPQLRPVRDAVKAIVGATYVMVVDKDGKITGIEGAEQALKSGDGLDASALTELKKRFEPDRLKRDMTNAYEIFPDILLRDGESWKKTDTMDLGGGQTLTFQKTYEYQGTVEKDGRTLDKIGLKADSVTYAMEPNPSQPIQVSDSSLKMESSEGNILFDREAGLLVESKLKMHIVGDMTLVAGGQNLPSKLDLTIETGSELQKPKK